METGKDISPASGKYSPRKRKIHLRPRFYEAFILLFVVLTFSEKERISLQYLKSKI